MKKTFDSLLIFSLLILTILPLSQIMTSKPVLSNAAEPSSGRLMKGFNPLTPGPDPVLANWTSNRLENYGFEVWDDPQHPANWSASASGDRYSWIASSPSWPVQEGAYSAGMEVRATLSNPTGTTWYQSNIGANMNDLNLTYWWYLHANEDPSNDYLRALLQLEDGPTSYWIYYYLNGTMLLPSNSSYYAYFKIGGPAYQWNLFSRNITEDFLAIPDFPTSISPTLELRTLRFQIQANGISAIEYLRAFIDDVYVQNTTWSWIAGSQRNGNFETGTTLSWNYYSGTDPAQVTQSLTSHSGAWSCNLTTFSYGNSSYADVSDQPYTRITSHSPGSLNLWWYIGSQGTITDGYAYTYVYGYNGSHSVYLYYFYWYSSIITPWTNASGANWVQKVFDVEGVNTEGSWIRLQRNLWTDLTETYSIDGFFITSLSTDIYMVGPTGRLTLLVDDAILSAPGINGGGFEDQRATGQPIRGFSWYEDSAFVVTDTSFSGSKAANLTLPSFSSFGMGQPMQSRPLNGTRETYLDVMWRLEDFSGTIPSAMIIVSFSDWRVLYYYIGGILPASNDTWYGYIRLPNAETTGVWVQMHRDLTHDYEAVWGSLPDTTLTYVTLQGNGGDGRLELLLDDLYLYDDPAPIFSQVDQNPGSPGINQPVEITCDIIEQDVDTVLLYYRVNSGTWHHTIMGYQTGLTYAATIPGQPYNTVVDYYITVNDTWGMTTTALDVGSTTFSYTILDSIDPLIQITYPLDGTEVNGTIGIIINANDGESGITRVELLIDDVSVTNLTSQPYEHNWDTTTNGNGEHTITAIAYDGASNSALDSVTVTVYNPITSPPIPGFPLEAVCLALVTSISLTLLRRRRQKQN